MKITGLLIVFLLSVGSLFAQTEKEPLNLPKSSELKKTKAKATSQNMLSKKEQASNDQAEIGQFDPQNSQAGTRSRMDGRPSPLERKIISRLINERAVFPTE
jgi:hypothetical protein